MSFRLLLILLLIIPGCFCMNQNSTAAKPPEDRIQCVHIYREFPFLLPTGKVGAYKPYETRIYYYRDQVMYQTWYYHASVQFEDMGKEPDYKYLWYSFVYTKGNETGIRCDSMNLSTIQTVRVDSMRKLEWADTTNLQLLLDQANTKPLNAPVTNDRNEKKIFTYTAKSDTLTKGRFEMLFSKIKFRDVPYSLSKVLDSINGMKLIEFDIYIEARDFPEFPDYHMEALHIPYRLKECDLSNEAALLRLFEEERKRQQ